MPLVTTTDRKDFKPVGRRADYTWDVLRERLSRELGPEFGHLLAEPVSEVGWGRIDWHTELNVSLKPASELDPAESDALLDRLHAMRQRVHELAARIEAPGPGQRGGDKNFADALRRAVVVPKDEAFVYSAAGAPVLIAWGHVYLDDERPEAVVIGEGLIRRRLPTGQIASGPIAVLPADKARRFPWSLLWLLFAALMAAIFYLLLQACGIFFVPERTVFARFLPAACYAHAVADPLADERSRRAELETRIREAQIEIARLQGDCAPPVQPAQPQPRQQTQIQPPATPVQPPEGGPSVEERLQREGAQTGELQITLAWNGLEDLDLHVDCPGGTLNFVRSNRNACQGLFQIDMNSEENKADAVEHALWAKPPPGRYSIQVRFYSRKGQTARTIPFVVRVKRGNDVQSFNGTASTEGETHDIHAFTLP